MRSIIRKGQPSAVILDGRTLAKQLRKRAACRVRHLQTAQWLQGACSCRYAGSFDRADRQARQQARARSGQCAVRAGAKIYRTHRQVGLGRPVLYGRSG